MLLGRYLADGIEIGDVTGGAELNGDIDDAALGQ
jgi:hypothetical protein